MADLNKIVDELSGLTVLEVAELVKTLEDKWGVSAAAPVAVAAAGGAAPAAAAAVEKTEFDVILTEGGTNKIGVIKEVRAVVAGLGLAEAKALWKRLPSLSSRVSARKKPKRSRRRSSRRCQGRDQVSLFLLQVSPLQWGRRNFFKKPAFPQCPFSSRTTTSNPPARSPDVSWGTSPSVMRLFFATALARPGVFLSSDIGRKNSRFCPPP